MTGIDTTEQTRRIASALERIEVCCGKLQSGSAISFGHGEIEEPEDQEMDSSRSEPEDAAGSRGPMSETEIASLEVANYRIEELEQLLENAVSENTKLKAEIEEARQVYDKAKSDDSETMAELRSELDSMVSRRAGEVSELDAILAELETLLATGERNA